MQTKSAPSKLLQQTSTVEQYFITFNQGDFLATAQLFAEAGQLLPPFEEAVTGQTAIRAYLEAEASGMQATPKDVSVEPLEGDRQRVVVRGNVRAILFTVNAAWIFQLDAQERIEQVEVKLLASLQELFMICQN